jgi:hypothetical protein
MPTSSTSSIQPTVQLPAHIIEIMHEQRESSTPFYSPLYMELYARNYISLAEYLETNTIMKPLTGDDFWNAVFDLMSFFLAEAGELPTVPDVSFASFTKRAVDKIRKGAAEGMTIHQLLEIDSKA